MTRNPFGWDLPPGMTQRHIDEAAGAYSEPEEEGGSELQLAYADLEIAQSRIVLLREALNGIVASGANSYRNAETKWDDVAIARTAYEAGVAAMKI